MQQVMMAGTPQQIAYQAQFGSFVSNNSSKDKSRLPTQPSVKKAKRMQQAKNNNFLQALTCQGANQLNALDSRERLELMKAESDKQKMEGAQNGEAAVTTQKPDTNETSLENFSSGVDGGVAATINNNNNNNNSSSSSSDPTAIATGTGTITAAEQLIQYNLTSLTPEQLAKHEQVSEREREQPRNNWKRFWLMTNHFTIETHLHSTFSVQFLKNQENLARLEEYQQKCRSTSERVEGGMSLIESFSKQEINKHLSSLNPIMHLDLNNIKTAALPILDRLTKTGYGYLFQLEIDRGEFPDYDKIVPKPIWLDKVKTLLEQEEITSLDQFVEAVERVFKNAILYNGPAAKISYWAKNMLSKFDQEIKKLLKALDREAKNKVSWRSTC